MKPLFAILFFSFISTVAFGFSSEEQKDFYDDLKEATNGNAKKQGMISYSYLVGWRVTKNPSEAVKWAQKAADNGDAWGQRLLGGFHFKGQGGLPKDLIKGYAYKLLAESNYISAGDHQSGNLCNIDLRDMSGEMTSGQIKDAKILAKELEKQIDANYEASKKK